MMRQKCILVLGMHRSGTSALTGVLSFLDIYIGTDLMKANDYNPKGFFENLAIYDLNRSILYDLDCSWHDLFYQSSYVEGSPQINNFIQLIKDLICNQFEHAPLFAIKDPRIVYLLPAYVKALNDLDIDINVIIPYRNPLEVALSLQKRDQFSIEKGMLLWLLHLIYAELGSRQYKRWFVKFDDLLSNTDKIVDELSSNLGLNLKAKYESAQEDILQFLSNDLKHYTISAQHGYENAPPVIHEVYQLLEDINAIDQTEKFDRIRREFSDFRRLFYCDDILSANRKVPLLSGQLKKLEAKYDHTQKNLTDREKELNAIQNKLTDREKELNAIQNKLKDKEGQFNEVIIYAESLEDKIKQLHQNIVEKHNENNHLNNELVLVYLSKSWRYTRIIRKLKRLF